MVYIQLKVIIPVIFLKWKGSLLSICFVNVYIRTYWEDMDNFIRSKTNTIYKSNHFDLYMDTMKVIITVFLVKLLIT